MDCSPPGFSVHGDSPGNNTGFGCHALLQVDLSNPGIGISCTAGQFFTNWATRETCQQYAIKQLMYHWGNQRGNKKKIPRDKWKWKHNDSKPISSVQFSSVAQSCPTLCDPMNHSTLGLSVYHKLPEFTQTHAHQFGDAIQPSHPLPSPSPPAPNPSQHVMQQNSKRGADSSTILSQEIRKISNKQLSLNT